MKLPNFFYNPPNFYLPRQDKIGQPPNLKKQNLLSDHL